MHPEMLTDLARAEIRDRLRAAADRCLSAQARGAPIPLMTDTGRVVALFHCDRFLHPQTTYRPRSGDLPAA